MMPSELLRTSYSHNSYHIFAYREAYAPLLCSYPGGARNHKTTPVQAHRGFGFCP